MKTRQFHTMISFVCAFVCYITSTVIASAETNLEVLATGSCGDNVTYTIYSDYSMVISGTGAISIKIGERSIKKVIIEEGVTSIGSAVFDRFYSLTSVTIPNSVTSIGNYAF